jgi:single-stranded-DNA-specific exonuclease
VALQRQPQLLITVDNGISSVEGVAAAKAAGLKCWSPTTTCRG